MQNTVTPSCSVEIKPQDSRCRYWSKIIRAGQDLPLPSSIDGAGDLPGPYLRLGEEELFPGDVMIEGEARHHRNNRGWNYALKTCREDGSLWETGPQAYHKTDLKAAGCPPEWLPGSGEIASLVRVAHGIRAGIVDLR